ISLRPFSPLAKGGLGGWSLHDQSQGLPMLSPSQSFCIPLARREESFSISKAPASPPLPPLRKGGKWIGRSRPRWIARNKNTRLETVPPVRSRPTLQRASRRVLCYATANLLRDEAESMVPNIAPEQVRKLAGWGLTQNDIASFAGWRPQPSAVGPVPHQPGFLIVL